MLYCWRHRTLSSRNWHANSHSRAAHDRIEIIPRLRPVLSILHREVVVISRSLGFSLTVAGTRRRDANGAIISPYIGFQFPKPGPRTVG
jgi:hypothetical protein